MPIRAASIPQPTSRPYPRAARPCQAGVGAVTVAITPTPGHVGADSQRHCLDGNSFRNLREARPEISHHFAYFNNERRHAALGYQSSDHFETHFKIASQRCAA
ncbi:integrase core domain-containing protein [Hymenobacter coccineus]|uniref:integrase core domain-containing protein n=1 Tax=Hymenobacter coccineus TaxID=1908235 RepID=UPI000F793778